MIKQEHFKQRIRARMVKTGECCGAARPALLDPGSSRKGTELHESASEPEFTDEVIRSNTGRGWTEWCDLIESWPGHVDGHAAVAAHIQAEYGLNGWWSQGVTVSWERITGRRLLNQRANGTFETSKTRTVTVDHDSLRAALFDDAQRADLFPGLDTEMRSKSSTKSPRIAFPDGFALFTLTPLDDGRLRVNVAHGQLASPTDVDHWKAYWSEWLLAVDESAPD